MADSELRQRKAKGDDGQTKQSTKRRTTDEEDYDSSSLRLDILRVLTFLFVASCGLSYVISSGESFFWGMQNKPNYLKPEWWKAKFAGPIYLTPDELSQYNGYEKGKPLYLAVNGTIFDVSSGLHMYGIGGSYHFFVGRDASRAYVSGCFEEDLTPDMRGLEEMYLPIDDPEIDSKWTTAEMKQLKEQELAEAKERVHSGLKHWVDFFTNSPKYQKVGYVKREEGWLEKLTVPPLCKSAQEKRKKRVPRDQQ
ncbi:heme/steroid binding domain protein [Cordyceps fumosorosea ARSEF 2679]|uniref:Heme/steroid binding domain protein n=1 Tax=Cordyceps fumosorosea (strain ARSEF 2679) TaxID=1081104 RepID=A0A167VVR9_CORFA|nr:heme/steroid binding domain protein [Cordyceps fumosorosea ARSEF 2679]OAA63033.1 heme/steroid binding domain protein [Cordyceps fumosorosea ARSEF 2679]